MGDFLGLVRMRGEIVLDLGPFGRRRLPVHIGEQPGVGDAAFFPLAHFTVLSRGSSFTPVIVLNAARARASRDISVPAGMPMIPAASW